MATFSLKSQMQGVMNVELQLIYLVTLLVSFVSWIFCIIKSWKLTKFDVKFTGRSYGVFIWSTSRSVICHLCDIAPYCKANDAVSVIV